MFKSDYEIKKQICEIGKRIYADGFVAANDGNISVKVDENTYFATPTGVSKGYMTPDVNAVVHAHPPIATSFAIAGIPLDKLIMPEAVIFLGAVPIAQYGTPSTMEIPESLEPYIQEHDAILLANHGALSFGCDLNTAFFRMESTEFYAKLLMYARLLGGEQEIPCGEVKKLVELRKQFNVPGRHPMEKLCPGCYEDGTCEMTPTEANEKFGYESAAAYHGFQPLPSQVCSTSASGDKDLESLVSQITKKVLAQYNK